MSSAFQFNCKTEILTIVKGLTLSSEGSERERGSSLCEEMFNFSSNASDIKSILQHRRKSCVYSQKTTENKKVRVCLYTEVSNPYLIIYDSDRTYAKPIICLKLKNCSVGVGYGNQSDTDDCIFYLNVGQLTHFDADQSRKILFRAANMKSRDEWISKISNVGKDSSVKRNLNFGLKVMPLLPEESSSINKVLEKH